MPFGYAVDTDLSASTSALEAVELRPTPGLLSLRRDQREGWQIFIF